MKKIFLLIALLLCSEIYGQLQVKPNYVDLTGVADSSIFIVKDGAFVPKTKAEIKSILGIPSSYKIYRALLKFMDTDTVLTVTILENTIGDIVWTRNSAGVYYGTLTGSFPINKVWLSPSTGTSNIQFSLVTTGDPTTLTFARINDNTVELLFGSGIDEGFEVLPIEIIVYP